MKSQPLILILLIAALFCGCASTPTAPANTAQVSDITILSAEFGMGGHVADVTPRVIGLLADQPSQGFKADYKTLGADPLPGKKKVLTIRYNYKGKACLFTVPGAKQVSYQALIVNATK